VDLPALPDRRPAGALTKPRSDQPDPATQLRPLFSDREHPGRRPRPGLVRRRV